MGDLIQGPWPDRDEETLTLVVGGASLPGRPLTTVKPRSCFDCLNGSFGPRGTWCLEYREQIDNERLAASDCPLYEPDDDGAA